MNKPTNSHISAPSNDLIVTSKREPSFFIHRALFFTKLTATVMEKVNFSYLLKNIPIPTNQQYLKCLLEKINSFVRRLRRKAFFFDNQNEYEPISNSKFDFQSIKNPLLCKDFSNFENDLYNLARFVKFRRVSIPLQDKLAKDLQAIHASSSLFISADKTTNLYKISTDDYNKLLQDNISAKYCKSNDNIQREINLEAKVIAEHLELKDKIEILPEQYAFLSLKDHKPNFQNHPKYRLINPSKSNLGKVSKQLLDNINLAVRKSTKLQQWRNTSAVITWFNNLPNKQRCKFHTFDVVDFYPSISEKLLDNAINYSKRFTVIDDHIINIIFHCRKSLLFSSDGIG